MGSPENSPRQYSFIAQFFHWLTVPAVIVLFGLGYWMVDLGYYDAWYQKAPRLHTGLGVLFGMLMLVRLLYRMGWRYPQPLATHKPIERLLGRVVHLTLYAVIFAVIVSGYTMVTVKGDPLVVFDWFELPALYQSEENLQDTAGRIHEIAAYILMILAAFHGLAALKHHFIDRDETLMRMAGRQRR